MSKEDTRFLAMLQANRTVLVRNIIPCKDLFNKVTQQNVFPNSMIKEIQDCGTNEEKNSKMVDLLALKGRGTILKFCDALQLSGHGFLSEFMRDEVSAVDDDELIESNLDKKDLMKRFPKLEKLLPENLRDDLVLYIRNKVKKEIIAASLRKQDDKEKVLDIRQNQLEESMKHQAVLKEKDVNIEQLQKSLNEAVIQVKNKELEVKHLSNYIEDLSKKHKKDLETQMQFNVANDKSLQRMSDKDNKSTEILEDMMRKMNKCMNDAGYLQRNKTPDKTVQLNMLDKVRASVNQLLEMVGELLAMRDKYQTFKDERRIVLAHLGIHDDGGKDDDFMGSFKKYVVTNEERVQGLMEQIRELEEIVREKTKTLENTLSLQGLIEALKADISLKDHMIQGLSDENSKLRNHSKTIHHMVPKNLSSSFRATQPKRGTPYRKRSLSGDGNASEEDLAFGGPASAGVVIHTKPGSGVQFRLATTRTDASVELRKRNDDTVKSQTSDRNKTSPREHAAVLPPLSQSQSVSFKLTTGQNNRVKGPFLKKPMQVGATQISTSVTESKSTTYEPGRSGRLLQARTIVPDSKQIKAHRSFDRHKTIPTFEGKKISYLR